MAEWLDYEKLAAKIYRQLHPNAEVKHNDKLCGYKSEVFRQIDVSIRTNVAGHNLLIIIQAKNHARPLDINAIGEFKTVIEDVRAQKGIIICNSGFTEAALKLARVESIDACTIHDTQSPNWGINLAIPLLWIEYSMEIGFSAEFVAERPNPMAVHLPSNPDQWVFSDEHGQAIPNVMIEFLKAVQDRRISWQLNQFQHRSITDSKTRIRFEPDYWMGVNGLSASFKVTASGWAGQFRISECRGIYNKINEKLTAHMRIDSREIPLKRDPLWRELGDMEKIASSSQNCLVVERWPSGFGEVKCKGFSVHSADEPVGEICS